MGAKLEAIRGGLVWTAVDAGGIESLSFRDVWTAVDTCGHRLDIYGSEGWGFEFLRACVSHWLLDVSESLYSLDKSQVFCPETLVTARCC